MIWMIFCLISIIALIFISYAFIVAMKRIGYLEHALNQIQTVISYSSERMKVVDSKGHFESDDETGFFFEELKKLQILLDSFFETETEKE
tara:strand:+ start:467 stop:736 length:270 start_codon:yes stop_codon:yes gene_type:complete